MSFKLTPDIASQFARLALSHITREYPNGLSHSVAGPEDIASPRSLHPIFFGSYDWHSCVHGYWLILHLLLHFPNLPEASRIIDIVDTHLTTENVAGEKAYLDAPHHRSFERPYGWAWLLALSAQLHELKNRAGSIPQAQRWAETFAPLTDTFVERFEAFLPIATYPLRVGAHPNTAFALTLALDFARQTLRTTFEDTIARTARRWYLQDTDCTAWGEPSGDEFLSPSLMEAALMQRVLSPDDFKPWLAAFFPHLASKQPATLFTPATVSDRSDGKIAHLDGLNLSRAWCFRALARGAEPEVNEVLVQAAEGHIGSALPHVAGDYMGEHWLATFATLALEA